MTNPILEAKQQKRIWFVPGRKNCIGNYTMGVGEFRKFLNEKLPHIVTVNRSNYTSPVSNWISEHSKSYWSVMGNGEDENKVNIYFFLLSDALMFRLSV